MINHYDSHSNATQITKLFRRKKYTYTYIYKLCIIIKLATQGLSHLSYSIANMPAVLNLVVYIFVTASNVLL